MYLMTYPVSDLNSSFFIQVQHCDQCQRTKRKFDRPATQLHPVPVPNYGWKQIGIDLVGPLPCSDKGNKYIIVVTDYFTKWPEVCASPTKEAIYVADFLFNLFLRHGCPDITISDQGKEFCNQVWMCQHDCIYCIP